MRYKSTGKPSYNLFMTDTVFCIDPRKALSEEIEREYKNGVVGIVGHTDRELFKLLKSRGNTVVAGGNFSEHVRCIIGAGGYEEIRKARLENCGKRIYLLTEIIDNICFAPIKVSDTVFEVPEKVFYPFNPTKHTRASAYAELLHLLVACLDAAAVKPDTGAFIKLAKHIKKMLEEPLDASLCARLSAKASEIFPRTGSGLISGLSFCKRNSPFSTDLAFFTNYLILAAFIQFTKYDFNGIFIGKDRTFLNGVKEGDKIINNYALSLTFRDALSEVLGDGKELSDYAKRYLWESGKKRFNVPFACQIFNHILEAEEGVEDAGLLALLCRIGFIDKLK